jgi:hypothetical protein
MKAGTGLILELEEKKKNLNVAYLQRSQNTDNVISTRLFPQKGLQY